MISLDEMRVLLKKSLPQKRFEHSLRVYELAIKLAEIHKVDIEKVGIAALLHDCGREVPTSDSIIHAITLGMDIDVVERNQPILLHAKLGEYYAKEKYGVEDETILKAIREHTTGAADMAEVSMIVYLADLLEPKRNFPNIDKLRKLAETNLSKAMHKAFEETICYLLDDNLLIHPDCIDGYNDLVLKMKKN